MEKNIKLRLLQSISKIYDAAKKSKFKKELLKKVEPELKTIAKYFKVSDIQSFFIAQIFTLNYKGDSVDINDLAEHFECNPVRLLEYSDDIDFLVSKGIIKKHKSKHRVNVAFTNDQFIIDKKITDAILNNLPLPKPNEEKPKTIIDILEKIYNVGQERDDKIISTIQLFIKISRIISSNKNFPLIKKVSNMNFEITDTFLFLYLIWKTVNGNETTDVGRALEGIFDNTSIRVEYMQKLLSKKNILIKNNLVEIVEAKFFNNTEIKLTDYSYDILKETGINLYNNTKNKDNIIKPDSIGFKELFYNNEEKKQLSLLIDLLDNSRLNEIQERLSKKNLPKGITSLLYGMPGTGKTETVYQIAKKTNREIMKVEISKSKSMWFGESEKIIKRIFTDYKKFSKQCKTVPILLFNEADAIISKRSKNASSSVAQTENAIQNIILEELENFEGIFFATTNLVGNLDSAFERRFLFKVEFHKPNMTIKSKIWQSKLSMLSETECKILSQKYNLSGGQIDNIYRKCEMKEIINGITPKFSDIIEFCEAEELLKNNYLKIGFANN